MKTRTKIQLLIFIVIVSFLSYFCAYYATKWVYEHNNKAKLIYLKHK